MRKIVIFALIAVMASGCSIYRKYQRPEELTADVDSLYRAELIADPEDTTSFGSMPWEELFTDPCLKDLIDSGLVHNTDLLTAIQRVEQAKASLHAAKWAYSPSLNLSPQGTLTSIDANEPTYTYNLGGAVSWDIDLFGQLLNAKRGAQATLLQQQAYQQAVRSQVISTIATSYYSLLMMDEQVRISDESVIIWKEQVRTMEAQLKVGTINENAVTQARANLYSLEASNAQLKQQQNISIRELNESGQNKEKRIDRFSRMEKLRVPPIDFYQLKVSYQTLIVENQPHTSERLRQEDLLEKADETLIHRQDLSGEETGIYAEDREAGEETCFNRWLCQISKESFNTLSIKSLKQYEDEMQTIFEAFFSAVNSL